MREDAFVLREMQRRHHPFGVQTEKHLRFPILFGLGWEVGNVGNQRVSTTDTIW